MDIKKLKSRAFLSAACAAVAYSAVAGKGFFNKPRFREQHDALSKYVDNNYPGCSYSPITIHGRGWASSIRRGFRVVSYVYFSKDEHGVYVFTESKRQFK